MATIEDRSRIRNKKEEGSGPVLYWMDRDQRVEDNWALLYARERAQRRGVPLFVIYVLPPTSGPGTLRHADFLLKGLQEVEETCHHFGIPFYLVEGDPVQHICSFVEREKVGLLIGDFNPLRAQRVWHDEVYRALSIQAIEVDAHNIVPCFVASPKEEFAAYTFRPKIHRLLPEYLTSYPAVAAQTPPARELPKHDWQSVSWRLGVDKTIAPVRWLTPGSRAAKSVLQNFINERLAAYHEKRNDPTISFQSNLSPYLHFGHISAQSVALAVRAATAPGDAKTAFLEELIVRRELADNFCYYNSQYDSLEGAHLWAQETLRAHASDPREYCYGFAQFEAGATHDDLWNAMQLHMVRDGKMHGWCRMYWAKKILEWTPDVATAIATALTLNDKYELDGSDPNGVVGVMWSICGVHDRAWTERPIFGKVRYMNYAGAKRKFDVTEYIEQYGNSDTLFT